MIVQKSSIVRWQNLLISLLLAGICIVIGWYSHHYYKQWDWTAGARHSLNKTSKAVVSLLDGPVKAVAVIGPAKAQREAIRSIFEKFQLEKKNLQLEFLNPETNPGRVKELKAHAGGEIILYYNDRQQRIRNLTERSLSNALQHLARPAKRSVLFITGHQERQAKGKGNGDYFEAVAKLSNIGYTFDKISLVTQPSIPELTDLLVIAAPIDSYFPGEVASILNYLSQGGNLLWLREPGNINLGLKPLEIELGVDKLAGKVVEANSRLFNVDSPTFVVINNYPPNPLTTEFSSITLFPEAAGLNVLPMQDRTIRPLLKTSDNSWTETDDIEGQVEFNENSSETRGPIILGVTINRDRGTRKQRIAVIGDADFMANTWLGNGGNQAFAQRLFNWLSLDDNMLEFVAAPAFDKQINISNTTVLSLAFLYLIVIPLTLFGFAFFVWHWQKKG